MEDPDTRLRNLSALTTDSVHVDHAIHPKIYFRSGTQTTITAGVYYDEGNVYSALVLYLKYIVLFVEKLPKHPQYKTPEVSALKKTTKQKLLSVVFPRAEELKAKLKEVYQREYDAWRAAEDARIQLEAEERARLEEKQRLEELARQERLAAIEEERRLAMERQQYAVAQEREHELGRQRMMEEERQRAQELERLELQHRQEAERLRQEEERQQALAAASLQSPVHDPPSYNSISLSPSSSLTLSPSAPPLDSVQSFGEPSDSLSSGTPAGSRPVVPDRSTKPKLTPAVPTAVEQGPAAPSSAAPNGFRWLRIPADIPGKFEQLALANTEQGMEFCGILCGSLQQNVFCITHVIIPKQTSTPDSCTMLNEEELFDLQDRHSLITLGWIHTHPTQTSFLSSVDLHTQFSYQVMMDEAVAIVCAPRYQQTGLYSLTKLGMQEIRQCRKQGFHPHAQEPPLFEDCVHTLVQSDLSATILDLRS